MIFWYSSTLFISAFLLFLVQPMVGKMVLPLYGGTPAVWNACMVFFQAMLLLGYAYAHLSVKWLGPRRQAMAQTLLLFVPLAALPIGITVAVSPPVDYNPVFWLLRKLLLGVGLPFFVLSSSAPLLQRWFSNTSDPSSKDPYFLYAASNTGSLIGLLGYPVLLEPLLSLTEQSVVWHIGYGILIFMTIICAIVLWRSRHLADNDKKSLTETLTGPEKITLKQRLFWLFSSFVPSSLMLSVTAYITTNIAAVPLLWVVPLALYLLTFILVFARKQLFSHLFMVRLVPFLLIPAVPLFFFSIKVSGLFLVLIHLLIFFVAAMACHGELAGSRPSTDHLTDFYFYMSVGGVLGGLFNTLVAPTLFNQIIEYPLALFLVCFVLPQLTPEVDALLQRKRDLLFPLLLAGYSLIIVIGAKAFNLAPNLIFLSLLFVPAALACFSFKRRPIRFALAFGVITFSLVYFNNLTLGKQLYVSRNFFGVKRVALNGGIRSFIHGTIIHGTQFVDPSRQSEPLSYYHRSGPVGDVFAAFNRAILKPNVAIIGLGVGSIAAYSHSGQQFVFYEIDPDIELIARNENYFTFLKNGKGRCDIVLGDGRLSIANAPDHSYGMIILDAFSSDSVPVHLLTKEALLLYLSKLEPKGMIVFNISNNFLDLAPLLGTLAKELGLECMIKYDAAAEKGEQYQGKYPSQYIVMGHIGPLIQQSLVNLHWKKTITGNGNIIWTDKYSNIVSLFKW